jgi:hypothetical protein
VRGEPLGGLSADRFPDSKSGDSFRESRLEKETKSN